MTVIKAAKRAANALSLDMVTTSDCIAPRGQLRFSRVRGRWGPGELRTSTAECTLLNSNGGTAGRRRIYGGGAVAEPQLLAGQDAPEPLLDGAVRLHYERL